ncbi:Cell morphoproteinsis protein PAG1 [Sphaceloma murrayae]|uniref:Cell morphoproteinsis protein PAG1 n=1 Tax=Sphaceloma murrayae TaxID=2082308 RepID=A0A2K1R0E5_9PEZI|nr:Cell morphoproteinsis protein PAG1 [Sphaceloma murrayae]
MPSRRRHPGPINPPRTTPSPGPSPPKPISPGPSPSSSTSTSHPPRPILRKKKSVTFHPSTKKSASQQNTPVLSSSPAFPAPSPPPTVLHLGPLPTGPPSKPALLSPFPAYEEPPLDIWTKPKLLDYSHLPLWRADNALILSGYRPQSFSHAGSVPSLWWIHNETCNIWSHLLGLAGFAAFGAWWLAGGLATRYPQYAPGDWWAFAAFFAGVCSCLAASALFHLFHNVGPAEARAWNGLDYAGIVACIWGSFVACLHFGFGNGEWREVRRGYEGMITGLALLCTGVSVLPGFRTPKWRPARAGMFVAMGLSAVVPVGHAVVAFGVAECDRRMGLSWVVRQGVLYIAGAGLYAARIPERWAPGRFDIWGSSHQIFHFLVVFAACAHLKGLLLALDYKYNGMIPDYLKGQ